MNILKFSVIIFLVFLIGCNNDENSEPSPIIIETLSGYAQKGPFNEGASISIIELNESLGHNGNTFTSQIIDNSGNFEFKDLALRSPFVQLQVDGFYFNEVSGEISNGQLTLFALIDISNTDQANVNILTHLEKGRVEFLVELGIEFNKAKDSARHELLSAFGVNDMTIESFEELNISENGTGNATLTALSVILQADNSVQELTDLLANINTDFRVDGRIDSEIIKSNLFNSTQELNLEEIRANLENRYSGFGLNTNISSFESIVDNYLTSQKPFELEAAIFNITCKGFNNGSIDITLTNGTEPFSYDWSNGEVSEDIENLSPGLYSLTVTDANNYVQSLEGLEITEPSEDLSVTYESSNVSEVDGSDGTISLTITGGTDPYTIHISDVEVSDFIEGLEKGLYVVDITDSNSCSVSINVAIQEPIGTFIDNRDGEEYETVLIGNQIWFADNIRSTQDHDGNNIDRYCLDTDSSCETYGGLYSKEVAQVICPDGWHLPTDADWKELESFLGMAEVDVNSSNNWRGNISDILQAGGSSGLNIELSGYRFVESDNGDVFYLSKGTDAFFWTEQLTQTGGLVRWFRNTENGIYRYIYGGTSDISYTGCRCVKDDE